jgi:PKD repeat protein
MKILYKEARILLLALVSAFILPENAAAQIPKGCADMANFTFKVECRTLIASGISPSTRTCPSYKWSLGNGTYATGQQISYKYPSTGTYTVCLKVVDSCRNCDTIICKTVTISGCAADSTCLLKPDFAFKVDCRNVVFEASSNQIGATYSWSFGDGSSSTDKAVKKSYLKDGTYQVCVTATWKNPITNVVCKETVCKKVTIQCGRKDPCTVSGNFTFKVSPNGMVGFNASSTGGFSYVWDFGDGTKGQGQNPTKQYSKPGAYTVCVTIYGKDPRCFVKICKKVVVEERCNIWGNFSFQSIPGTTGFKFLGTASEKGATFSWSFGDGTGASTKDPQKYFSKPGVYEVCLTIKHPNGRCSVRICKKIIVGAVKTCNNPVSFGWGVDKTNCLKYNFEAPVGNCVKYKWAIGGQLIYSRFTSYTFAKAGTYQVCLYLMDTCNKCDTVICKSVVVTGCDSSAKKCNMGISVVWPSGVKECAASTFQVKYTDNPALGCRKATWTWSDGTAATRDMTASHKFKRGTYNVCVRIIDSCKGCDTTICKSITVTSCCGLKAPDFTYTINCDKISFEGNLQNCGKYVWSLGNGTYANGRLVTGTYVTGKSYTVCLKVADTCNACDTLICKTISVPLCNPCKIESSFVVDSIVKGKVFLTNKSSSNAVYFSWDFGDGTKSTSSKPGSKTYTATGTYKICLTVWDQTKACSATFCKTITISSLRSNASLVLPAEDASQAVKVYPNPAFDKVQVEWGTQAGIKTVEVLDLNGRLLQTVTFNESVNAGTVDLSSCTEGLYLIRVHQNGSSSVHRINHVR